MITLEEVVPVGQFLKPHGVKGEISATVNVEDIEAFSAIICSMDGILVPFFYLLFTFKKQCVGAC